MMREFKVVDGLWVGDMSAIPYRPQYTAVLTVNEDAGRVDDQIKHRHLEMLDCDDPQGPVLGDAVAWARGQWEEGKQVLIRSQLGVNRPAYVVAALFIEMGATCEEALASLRARVPDSLTNPAFLNHLETL